MSNPNFIIFIQLSHCCQTSEIIIVTIYGCELYTIPGTLLTTYCLFVCLMVFNATFDNISVISWQSVLLVEETGTRRKPSRLHIVAEIMYTIYNSCKLPISRNISITDIGNDLVEFNSLMWTKINIMCQYCSKCNRLIHRLVKMMYFRQRDSYQHRWHCTLLHCVA